MKNRLFLAAGIALLILLLDQWIKYTIKTRFYLGEEIPVIGTWFRIHFTENYGMAFGMEFGGKTGKEILSWLRIAAVAVMGWYVYTLAREQAKPARIIAWTLIWSGAVGNIIDSVFYGIWFGYDTWLHGRVVDMFYFPIIQTTIPEDFPFWKGESFEFFRPVFNLADAAISIGFGMVFITQMLVKETASNSSNTEAQERKPDNDAT